MLTPETKQETSAGLWILYVNKYTEDISAFEGSRGFVRKSGPIRLRLSPRETSAGSQAAWARGSPSLPKGSRAPDLGCEFLKHKATE